MILLFILLAPAFTSGQLDSDGNPLSFMTHPKACQDDQSGCAQYKGTNSNGKKQYDVTYSDGTTRQIKWTGSQWKCYNPANNQNFVLKDIMGLMDCTHSDLFDCEWSATYDFNMNGIWPEATSTAAGQYTKSAGAYVTGHASNDKLIKFQAADGWWRVQMYQKPHDPNIVWYFDTSCTETNFLRCNFVQWDSNCPVANGASEAVYYDKYGSYYNYDNYGIYFIALVLLVIALIIFILILVCKLEQKSYKLNKQKYKTVVETVESDENELLDA